MRDQTKRQTTAWSATAVVVALVLSGATALAGVDGNVYKKSGGPPISGNITWYAASQAYAVTTPITTLRIPLKDVQRVDVGKPGGLDGAIQMVRSGNHAGAVGALSKIANDYEMLKWDVVAARWLAEAYLNLGQTKQAIDMCEKVIRGNPDAATSGELARIYWDSLEKDGRTATLTTVLGEAIKTGGREVAATAQIKRADIARSQKNLKKALVEGYLRTAILFGDVKSVQPEALLKAAECFDELGQRTYAERMRKRLLDDYPQSAEAQKVRAGA